MSKELIRLRDLSMAYDDEPVLNHINLYINDKEFLTLLGPSGLSLIHIWGLTLVLPIQTKDQSADWSFVAKTQCAPMWWRIAGSNR